MTSKKRTCNEAFFAAIDTEEKAYWVGFLAADGYVRDDRGTMQLRLARRDSHHVARLRQVLRSDHPIYEGTTRSGWGEQRHSYSELYIRSTRLVGDLARHGVVQRKSFTVRWPVFLEQSLLRHYLRGYMDGNGGFYVQNSSHAPGRLRLRFEVTSNRALLLGAQEFLVATCGLARTRLSVTHPREPRICKMRYGAWRDVMEIFHLLYDSATVWLPRKRSRIEPFL